VTLRPATPGDLAWMTGFLQTREEGSMFLLSNIAADGLIVWSGDPPADRPHAMRLWRAGDGAVLGMTAARTLIAQCPGPTPQGLRGALAGFALSTLLAPDGQVPHLLDALGLTGATLRHREEEPGFRLDLGELILPEAAGCHSRPLAGADRRLLHGWRAAYLAEVFGVPPAEAAAKAREDVEGWLVLGSHRLLVRDGVPVALSGFNAMLPQAVQVGGVYTPPPLRGQGLARRAVAMHLAEAREAGVRRAYLFAANAAAARAYAAIGFRRSGSMGIAQFDGPQRIAMAGDPACP
jgi:GNAT superfamily N-acetyltransferase